MEHITNRVILRGTLSGAPEYSHENHGREFYRFYLEVPRLSSAVDILPVIASRDLMQSVRLDEGGMILEEPIGGAKGTYAMIGVGEKGCADLKFIARSAGGHASTPGKNTPLVRLGQFMAEVEKKNLFEKIEVVGGYLNLFVKKETYISNK